MARVKSLPVPYSRYAVSGCGKIVLSRARGKKWRRIKLIRHKKGYVVVNLYHDSADRTSTMIAVHILVMLAWVGPCPEGMEVCHYPDGDKTNNSLDNLVYGTKKQNQAHRYEQGCGGMGEKHYGAVLTEAQVRQARKEWKPWGQNGGKTIQALADEFGVGRGVLWAAVRRKTWKHIL